MKNLENFWHRHPALLYGLIVFLGIHLSLHPFHWTWAIALGAISLPLAASSALRSRLRLLLALLLGAAAFLFCGSQYTFPDLPPEGIQGTALINIHSISSTKKHYASFWRFKGVIEEFESTNQLKGKNLPFILYLPINQPRPVANHTYALPVTLKPMFGFFYGLNIKPGTTWTPIAPAWRLPELRLAAKQWILRHLKENLKNPQVATFLGGLATGDFDDRLMTHEFSRFGLQHIMAISGFHFSLIAGMLALLLRCFLSPKNVATSLIVLLSSYFLFIGYSPSIQRAWLSIQIVLLGTFLHKTSVPLNTLGLAMLVILLFDPLLCAHTGFQFSFLATAAILLFHESCDRILQIPWHKRTLSEAIEMSPLHQHGYVLLALFRQSLALTIAVHLVILPFMLYSFHRFPLLSLLYNLFYPFLVSISMALTLAAMPFAFIPFCTPIEKLIHAINNSFTTKLLNLIYETPSSLDFSIRVPPFDASFIALYLIGIFIVGILAKRSSWGQAWHSGIWS